jgi:hypothetical protein
MAQSNKIISGCFAGFDVLVNEIGEKHISLDVRKNCMNFLENWKGEVQPMGNQWLENKISTIENEKKPLARLILLAAIQPYKITKQHINELRKQDYKDDQIIAATSWGSWQATKRISTWLC